MPLYEYRCEEGHTKEAYFPLASDSPVRKRCDCGRMAKRLFPLPHVHFERTFRQRASDRYFSPAMMDGEVEQYRYLRDNENVAKGKPGASRRVSLSELKND